MADANAFKYLSNNKLRYWVGHVHQDPKPTASYLTRQARESHLGILARTLYVHGFNPKSENTRQKHIEVALRA